MAGKLTSTILLVLGMAATSTQQQLPDWIPVASLMTNQNYAMVVLDNYKVTESDQSNCASQSANSPGNCKLIVEPKLCFVDEKGLAVGDCVKLPSVRIERGDKLGRGAYSGYDYGRLACLALTLSDSFAVLGANYTGLADLKPAHTWWNEQGCVAWLVPLSEEQKYRIDHGWFEISASFRQSTEEAKKIYVTGILTSPHMAFHLAPTILHLNFYDGEGCEKQMCEKISYRFAIYTEHVSAAGKRPNAHRLRPMVACYDTPS